MTSPNPAPEPDRPAPEQSAARPAEQPAAQQPAAQQPAAQQPAPAAGETVVTDGPSGLLIRLPTDPEALRRLEAREDAGSGGEPACLLPRLCPRCGAPGETSVNRICTDCGAALAG